MPAQEDRATTERVVPPYNGFGSDEDSMTNCLSLLPRPPKRDFAQFMELDKAGYDGHVLRFLARLDSSTPDPAGLNEQRRFIISYFLADGTVNVFEQSSKNVGVYCNVLSIFARCQHWLSSCRFVEYIVNSFIHH